MLSTRLTIYNKKYIIYLRTISKGVSKMTKKAIAFLCTILCAFIFTSCMELSVEDMLSAPSLTTDQISIINALEAQGEKFTLLYPSSGDRRTPIQFIDLDGDNVYEATVFYNVEANGETTARFAVLEKTTEEWRVVSVVDGAGTDVESISVLRITNSAKRTMLVEWALANADEHKLTAYRYADDAIDVAFEDFCTDMVVYDIDDDAFSEFIYIKATTAYEPYIISCVKIEEDNFLSYGRHMLTEDVMECLNFVGGKLGDGRKAVFVDENLGNGFKVTEVFVLSDKKLIKLTINENETFTLDEISSRSVNLLEARRLFDDEVIYIPSAVKPTSTVLQPDAWTFWYTVNGDALEYSFATYIESGYKLALTVPDEWLSAVTIRRSENEPRLIEITREETGEVIFSLMVLTVGEDSDYYTARGFDFVKQSGSYRYYALVNCTDEEYQFIRSNFIIL